MQVKLSKSDRIILSNIEWNLQITEKQLAKLTNLSKDGVRYRIRRLENNKVIQGYGVLIDFKKLGFESYKNYLKLQATREEINKLKEYLKTKSEVFAYFESRGRWNFTIAYFAENSEKYYLLENELIAKFGNLIVENELCQMVDATIQTNKALYEYTEFKEFKIWGQIKEPNLDNTKKIILEAIKKNPKIKLHELCKLTSKSIETVMRKKKELETEGIISVYHTKINYPLLDREIYKMFIYLKNHSPERETKLLNYIKQLKQTRDIIRTIGPWKFEVELVIKQYQEYLEIVEDLNEKFEDMIKNSEFIIFRDETFHPDKNNPEN